MRSRFTMSFAALVLGVSALASTGCAGTVGTPDVTGSTEAPTGSVKQELDPVTLFDTVQSYGQKAGPVLGVASMIYGFYTNVPGKLDAINAKLDGIAGDTAAIKTQLAAVDTKLDAQFQARNIAPMATAENFIAGEMSVLTTKLDTADASGAKPAVDDALWTTESQSIANQYQAVDTAGETILEYFAPPDATASKWTATQWYRIYGHYLRATTTKLLLRDAQATLSSTYWDRAPAENMENMSSKATYAVRKQIAIADLDATVKEVVPKLRRLRDFYVAARDVPTLQKQQCFENGKYTVTVVNNVGFVNMSFPYMSFRDPGAQYTSQQYRSFEVMGTTPYDRQTCQMELGGYKQRVVPQIDAFVKSSLDDQIATIEASPNNWIGK